MTGLEPLLAGMGQSGFSSTASSSASLLGGDIVFAPYSLSPVTASGNESDSGVFTAPGVPVWVWVGLVAGAVYFARRK